MRAVWIAFRGLAAIALAAVLVACALHVSNSGQTPVPPRPADALRVATHNVHYIRLGRASGPWSVGDWERRKAALDRAFKTIDPDVMAFQEMESFAGGNDGSVNLALDYLLERNPGHAAAAVGDWRVFPSTQPILYRTDRLELLDQGWFFFSETPGVIYSRTFDGSYPAFASWARFAADDGRGLAVMNVHFDYGSRANRARSAKLVAERLSEMIARGEPVFLAGDLNERAGSSLIAELEEVGLDFVPVEGSTYHFNRGINLFGAIDHIARTKGVDLVAGPVVLRRRFEGEWPSDHYPIFADFRLPGSAEGG